MGNALLRHGSAILQGQACLYPIDGLLGFHAYWAERKDGSITITFPQTIAAAYLHSLEGILPVRVTLGILAADAAASAWIAYHEGAVGHLHGSHHQFAEPMLIDG